jgi:predicted DNA-binding transcriptional regulator AlpA
MPLDPDLVPLKRVLQFCDVSRATLWRVSRAELEGFPEPIKKSGRIYWRLDDLDALKRAIEKFEGRTMFDQRRESARRRAEARCANLAALKRDKGRSRRPRARAIQADLFGGAS